MIVQGITNSFRGELLSGLHNFGSTGTHIFRMALYTAEAPLNEFTATYITTNEVSGAGYTAGGIVLTGTSLTTTNNISYVTFNNAVWTNVTINPTGALIYNSSSGNRAVCVLHFGRTFDVVNATFTVQMPAATPSTALIILD